MHSKKKNYLCFIPARIGSSRLKNKNLKKINKNTLVEITIKLAKKTNFYLLYHLLRYVLKIHFIS